jgi:hypothetical protein
MLNGLQAGYDVFRFTPSPDVHRKYKDGGVAIIDQIICSHARFVRCRVT